jgi:transcriptional regulator with XRE-family HTH domain
MRNGSFGQWVRSVRLAKGMTAVEAAELVGFKHSQSIANIESGRSLLPVRYAKRFCKVMGVSEHEFIKQMLKEYELQLKKELHPPRKAA